MSGASYEHIGPWVTSMCIGWTEQGIGMKLRASCLKFARQLVEQIWDVHVGRTQRFDARGSIDVRSSLFLALNIHQLLDWNRKSSGLSKKILGGRRGVSASAFTHSFFHRKTDELVQLMLR